jgi:hypothetical protein
MLSIYTKLDVAFHAQSLIVRRKQIRDGGLKVGGNQQGDAMMITPSGAYQVLVLLV